jgi:hypothetical protein
LSGRYANLVILNDAADRAEERHPTYADVIREAVSELDEAAEAEEADLARLSEHEVDALLNHRVAELRILRQAEARR